MELAPELTKAPYLASARSRGKARRAFIVKLHSDFDDAWLTDVPVDHECRPLVKWVEGVAWTRTDLTSLSEAQAEPGCGDGARIAFAVPTE